MRRPRRPSKSACDYRENCLASARVFDWSSLPRSGRWSLRGPERDYDFTMRSTLRNYLNQYDVGYDAVTIGDSEICSSAMFEGRRLDPMTTAEGEHIPQVLDTTLVVDLLKTGCCFTPWSQRLRLKFFSFAPVYTAPHILDFRESKA